MLSKSKGKKKYKLTKKSKRNGGDTWDDLMKYLLIPGSFGTIYNKSSKNKEKSVTFPKGRAPPYDFSFKNDYFIVCNK